MTQPSQPQPERNQSRPRPYPLLVAGSVGEARDRQLAAARQHAADRLMHNAGDPEPAQPDYSAINAEYLKEQLKLQRGSDEEIADDDPELQDLQRRYDEFSIDKIHPDNWYVGQVQDPNALIPTYGPSGIDQFNEMMQANYDLSRDGDTREDDPPQNPELEALRETVDGLRKKHNEIVAELMALPIYRRKKKRQLEEEYHKITDQLNMAIAALLDKEVTTRRAQGADNAAIIDFLESYANQHQLADRDAQRKLMLEEGGPFVKFMERYANANTATKIAIGLGATAMIAVTVATAGAAAAGAGFGVAASGAVAGTVGAASRIGKTYALRVSSIFQDDDEETKIDRQTLEQLPRDDNKIYHVLEHMNDETKIDMESAEKKKKTAVYWALGTVAVGSTVGTIAEYTGVFGGDEADRPKAGAAAEDDKGDDQNKPRGTSEDTSGETPKSELDTSEVSKKAFQIKAGEGWFQTFQELGVDAKDYDELLEASGDDLVKAGYAYEDPDIGGYGMLMTDNGRLPEGAMKILAEHAQAEHISMDANLTAVSEATSAPTAAPTGVPEGATVSEADADKLHDAYEGLDPQEAASVHAYLDKVEALAGLGHNNEFNLDNFKAFDGDSIAYSKLLDDMGVAKGEWANVLKAVAPDLSKLRDIHGNPLAYVDAERAWHIVTTGGNVPKEAVKVISQFVDKKGLALAA